MDFSEEQLPQLSELASRLSPIDAATTEYTSNENVQSQAAQTSVYTTAVDSSYKQTSMNSSTKYTSPLFPWSDPLYSEKHNNQMINIPNLSQNNTLLGVHTNVLSPNFISLYLPHLSQAETIKQEIGVQSEEQRNSDTESQSQLQQSSIVAEYLQKWQATTLPIALQQLIKMQTEQVKKELVMEEKIEHSQNNILNIPSVPTFRSTQLQNGGSFVNADQMMVPVNPNDLNVHLENEQENQSNLQPVVKVEQQIQTDLPKIEKKPKFRAKIGEIKISLARNGSMVYCCPECDLAFHDKADIEVHIQAHIQERKYECKECGAMLKRKEHLDQHMRGHSDERPYKCPLCEKAFKRNEHLTRHYVIHSGNKDFTCRVCQKAFSRKDHLNKHTQTHSGIRKNKKKDSYLIDQKDLFDKSTDTITMPKQEVSYILKDGYLLKQETTFLHHIQNTHKDSALLSVLSSFRDQAIKDPNVLQQQSMNTNEIMSQNTRHLMPS